VQVKDLIKLLKKQDPEAEVLLHAGEDGRDNPVRKFVSRSVVKGYWDDSNADKPFTSEQDADESDEEGLPAIILQAIDNE
jgi:hypothetical protein